MDMDATSLLDKPVLCAIDTRSVQKYLFHANGVEESVGAEAVLQTFPIAPLRYAVAHVTPPLAPDEYVLTVPNDESEAAFYANARIKVQVMDFAATNTVLFLRGAAPNGGVNCSGRNGIISA